MHQYVIQLQGIDVPVGYEIDHINRDKLDNTRENLRVVTRMLNQHNTGIRHNNKSGYKGVIWRKRSNKWVASIRRAGIVYALGDYDTPEEASQAYVNAEREWQDTGIINKPQIPRRNNKSGHRGVYWHVSVGKWIAAIHMNGRP